MRFLNVDSLRVVPNKNTGGHDFGFVVKKTPLGEIVVVVPADIIERLAQALEFGPAGHAVYHVVSRKPVPCELCSKKGDQNAT